MCGLPWHPTIILLLTSRKCQFCFHYFVPKSVCIFSSWLDLCTVPFLISISYLGAIIWDSDVQFIAAVLWFCPWGCWGVIFCLFVLFLFCFVCLFLTFKSSCDCNSPDFSNRSIYAVTMFRLAIKLLSLPVSSVLFLLIWGHCHLRGKLKTYHCDCSHCGRGLWCWPLAWQHFSSSIPSSEM